MTQIMLRRIHNKKWEKTSTAFPFNGCKLCQNSSKSAVNAVNSLLMCSHSKLAARSDKSHTFISFYHLAGQQFSCQIFTHSESCFSVKLKRFDEYDILLHNQSPLQTEQTEINRQEFFFFFFFCWHSAAPASPALGRASVTCFVMWSTDPPSPWLHWQCWSCAQVWKKIPCLGAVVCAVRYVTALRRWFSSAAECKSRSPELVLKLFCPETIVGKSPQACWQTRAPQLHQSIIEGDVIQRSATKV